MLFYNFQVVILLAWYFEYKKKERACQLLPTQGRGAGLCFWRGDAPPCRDLPLCLAAAPLLSFKAYGHSSFLRPAPSKNGMALPVRAFAFVSYFLFGLSLLLIRQDFKKGQTVPAGDFMSHARAVEAFTYQSLGWHPSLLSAQMKPVFLLLHIRGQHGETLCLDLVFPLLPLGRV